MKQPNVFVPIGKILRHEGSRYLCVKRTEKVLHHEDVCRDCDLVHCDKIQCTKFDRIDQQSVIFKLQKNEKRTKGNVQPKRMHGNKDNSL